MYLKEQVMMYRYVGLPLPLDLMAAMEDQGLIIDEYLEALDEFPLNAYDAVENFDLDTYLATLP